MVIGVAVTTCRIGDLLTVPEAGLIFTVPGPDQGADSVLSGGAALHSKASHVMKIYVGHTGKATLDWSAKVGSQSSPWLSIQNKSGSSGDSISVVGNPIGLAVGEYRDSIIVTSDAGGAVSVPVRFQIDSCAKTSIAQSGGEKADTLNGFDCGSPHNSGSQAQVFSFVGNTGDIATVLLSAGFDGFVALETSLDSAVAPLATATQCLGDTKSPCIYYFQLPQQANYYIEVSGSSAADTGQFDVRLITGSGRDPNSVQSLEQRLLPDSSQVVAIGGAVGANVLIHGVVSDSDLVDSLRLQAEWAPIGTAFQGQVMNTGPYAHNGQVASVTLGPLSDNIPYHWQVRAVDQRGNFSSVGTQWDSMPRGSSPDFTVQLGHNPNVPTALTQLQFDGVQTIPVGGYANSTTVKFRGQVTDPDPGDVLHLEVEVEQLGQDTTGTASPAQATTASSGGTSVATVIPPTIQDLTSYHWIARTVDQGGRHSPWVSFGNNPEISGTDFRDSVASNVNLVWTVQPPAQTTAGAAMSPNVVITAKDALNQTITSFNSSVTITIASGPGPFSPSATTTVNASAGVATFSNLIINKAGTGYSLLATSGTTNSVPSQSFTIVAAPAAQMAFTGQPTTAASGATITPAVQVTVQDAFGNTALTYATGVTLAIRNDAGPGGVLAGTTTATTANGHLLNGVATFNDVSIVKTGNGYTLGATSGSLPASPPSSAFNITTGVVTHLAFTVQPNGAQAGQTIIPAVQVAGEDANNNVVTSFAGTVTLAIGFNPPGNGILSGAPPTAAFNGVATFSNLSIDKIGTGYTLVATTSTPGVTGSTSNAFNISNTQISNTLSTVVANPTTITASSGASQSTITVTARDLSNNTVAGASVSLSVTGLGNTVLPAGSQSTNGAGTATWTLSSTTAEVKTVTAVINSVTISQQPTVTVNHATAAALAFTVPPSQTTAGLQISPGVQVTVQDAFGNTATSFIGNVAMAVGSGPGGTLTGGPTTVAASAGVATFSNLRIRTPVGAYTLQASTTAPSLSATSGSFNIVAGSATRDTFIVQPANTPVTARIDSAVGGVTVWITDSIGNRVITATNSVTVALFDNSAGGTLGGTKTRAAAAGIATFNDLTVNKISTVNGFSPYTLIANAAGLAADVSAPFDIVAGPAKSLVFKVQPSTVVAGAAISPPVQVAALDVVGDTATGFTGNVTMSVNPSSGNIGGTVTVAASGGFATFSNLTVAVAGNYTLTASTPALPSGPVTSGTSASFTVQPGGVSIINSTIIPSPTTITACKTGCSPGTTASTITVTARDAANNPISGQSVVISTNGNGDAITQPASLTDVNGQTTGTITDTTVEVLTVRATIGGTLINAAPTVSVSAAAPAVLVWLNAGQPRDTTAGAALRAPGGLQVRVQDQFHNNVPGATNSVDLAILIPPSPNNGATMGGTHPKAATGGGIATFTNITIDKVGTPYALLATSIGLTPDTSSQFSITAGTATQLSITTQPSANAQSGIAIPQQPAIQLLDALSNPVNQSGVVITASINTGPGGGSVGGTTTATTNGSGLATFSTLNITGPVGSYTLHFATGGLSVNSGSVALSAGGATQLSITTQPSTSAQSGIAIPQQPAIQLLDASNNPVNQSGIVITATINTGPGGSSVGGTTTATTNGSGLATFSTLNISGPVGTYTLHFASGSLTAVNSGNIALSAGNAAKLSITTQPSSSAQSGVAFGQQPVIQVLDAANNPVSQSLISVTATINSGGGAIGGTTSVNTNSSGVATFTNLSIAGTIGNRTLHFAATSLTAVNSATINLTAGPASKLVFTTQPSATTAGQTIGGGSGVVVTAEDAQNNVATTFGGSVTIAITAATGTSGATLSGTSSVPLSSGVATFSNLSIDSAGTSYKLDAASGAFSVTSTAFNINAGAVAQLVFTVQPTDATANTNISPAIVVTAKDAIGNTVTSFTGNVDMTIGVDGALIPPATLGGTTTRAAVAGQATFSDLQIDQPGTGYKLQAAVGAVTALSAAFDIL